MAVNGLAPDKLRAWVSDSCNAGASIPVTFRVTAGNGQVLESGTGVPPVNSEVTVLSSASGHAEVDFIAGPDPGTNLIEANFPGNTGRPAVFVITGVASNPLTPTSFVGQVQDNSGQPMVNAKCRLRVNGVFMPTVFSDVDGLFAFTDTPSGPGDLFVDGATATAVGSVAIPLGTFPSLHYEFIVIANAENQLPMPVLLPPMNPNNNVIWDGTYDVELTCEGMEGLKMIVTAGSMRKPDGSLVAPNNPATLSLNQVHHDDIPMPIPDGASPPFTWTLQPGGSHFDPPIRIEYPNMTGMPAGGIAYFLSFNHDTSRFEIVSSGHVTADGSTVVTDPGGGLAVAGWGGSCPPYSAVGGCASCPYECVDKGTLSGGTTKVNKTLVCVGELVTFSVNTQSMDSGGKHRLKCVDSEGVITYGPVELIPKVSPVYDWTISDSGFSISGSGTTASFVPPAKGTYSCVFTANANRDCPPSSHTLSAVSVEAAAVTMVTSSKDAVCVNETVTFTALGGPFPPGQSKWSGGGVPATGTGPVFTTKWTTPGNKTVTANCGPSSGSMTIRVVQVASLASGGTTSTGDNSGTATELLVCPGPPGATIDITASPSPGTFPPGQPVWSTGEFGTATISIPIDTQGLRIISARCNTSVRYIRIRIELAEITSVTEYKACPNIVATPNHPPSVNGCTGVPDNPAGGTGACDTSFLNACNSHDICYETCNSIMDDCDSEFGNAMTSVCSSLDPNCGTELIDDCFDAAALYASGVTLAGFTLWRNAQISDCSCCEH